MPIVKEWQKTDIEKCLKEDEIETLTSQLREKTVKVDDASESFHREYREWLIMFNRLTFLEQKLVHIGRLL